MTHPEPTPRIPITWGTIYYRYIRKGYDQSYAAFMADQWKKRKDHEQKCMS